MFDKNILNELNEIKKSLIEIERNNTVLGDWLPKKTVQKLFDYSDTQLRDFEKEQGLLFTKIKSRKFYSRRSLLEVFEKHKTLIKNNAK